jgi:hypothetical protein
MFVGFCVHDELLYAVTVPEHVAPSTLQLHVLQLRVSSASA